jgi:carbon monoxide dehydrogenase subunit G
MRITHTIVIAASPAEVFCWIDDPERAKRWMSSVESSRILHETPERVGTTFVETVAEGGRSTELRGTVVGYEPDRWLAMHLVGESHAVDVEFRLEPAAAGTRLTQDAELRFRGTARVMMLFLGSILKRKIRRQTEIEFAALARLCEDRREDAE